MNCWPGITPGGTFTCIIWPVGVWTCTGMPGPQPGGHVTACRRINGAHEHGKSETYCEEAATHKLVRRLRHGHRLVAVLGLAAVRILPAHALALRGIHRLAAALLVPLARTRSDDAPLDRKVAVLKLVVGLDRHACLGGEEDHVCRQQRRR